MSNCIISFIPQLFLYQMWGASSYALNVTLLVIAGILVNGPYALITTAVSAELGECPSPPFPNIPDNMHASCSWIGLKQVQKTMNHKIDLLHSAKFHGASVGRIGNI